MRGRIQRADLSPEFELPEVGRIRIGKKVTGANGREYPTSVDYFIPTGKYSDLFLNALGEKPSTIQIVFPSDDAEKVCNERYEYRDNAGALVASGDGVTFKVWDSKNASYITLDTEQYPRLMEQIATKYPTRRGADNWDIVLTMRFIVPAVRGIVGVWQFSTKGKASSIRNIRESFDGVQAMRGSVTTSVFDLSVTFAKSNKPSQTSRYPVVSMVANDTRIAEIRKSLAPEENLKILMPNKEK